MTESELSKIIANAVHIAISHSTHFNVRKCMEQFQVAMRRDEARRHINPIVRKGAKYFSQNDEDGILLEILRRCGLSAGTFVEFGVGNGLENNTLILLMHGWRGCWFGGEDLAFSAAPSARWAYQKVWIKPDNAVELVASVLDRFQCADVDVMSIDLDGMDIYVVEQILGSGKRPTVIVCEYNAKFPPPVDFRIAYDQDFVWDGQTDYSAASLQEYVNVLSEFGYMLVACNITGANAFFVRTEFASGFHDVPTEISVLYAPPNDGVVYTLNHAVSPRTVRSFIERD
jgi:hypothetical protein